MKNRETPGRTRDAIIFKRRECIKFGCDQSMNKVDFIYFYLFSFNLLLQTTP